MEAHNEVDLLCTKVKAISQGPNAELLKKFIDLLYDQEMQEDEPEYFSPEDMAAIEEGMKASCVWKYKRGPFREEMAVEKGTTVAALLVTRFVSDILGQRGRGDDHGGPEGDHTPGVFSEPQVNAGDCQGVAP